MGPCNQGVREKVRDGGVEGREQGGYGWGHVTRGKREGTGWRGGGWRTGWVWMEPCNLGGKREGTGWRGGG